MNKDEYKIIIKALKAVYADPKFIADQYAFDVWYSIIGELDYRTAELAVKRYMATQTRVPTPADILAQARSLDARNDAQTEQEAWNAVYKVVSGLDWTNPQRKYDTLPEICKKIVTLDMVLSWAQGDENELQTVIRSAFRKSYEVALKGDQEDRQLPRMMRVEIGKARNEAMGLLEAM